MFVANLAWWVVGKSRDLPKEETSLGLSKEYKRHRHYRFGCAH